MLAVAYITYSNPYFGIWKKLHCALTRLRRSAMHTKAYTVLGSRTKDHEETKHNYGLEGQAWIYDIYAILYGF